MIGDRRLFSKASWQEHIHNAGLLLDTTLPSMLSAALWNVAPLLSPRAAHSLGLASPAVNVLLSPASEQAKLVRQITRDLQSLPFTFDFPLPSMSPKALKDMLSSLRPIRPLRKRELVGRDAGWVPTESEPWCFQSQEELLKIAEAERVARRRVSHLPASGPVLFGATLRIDDSQILDGPLWTSPVGVEWAYGPAADPLQLGLRLGFQSGSVEIGLDIESGGWSPWAEQWSLVEGTLSASIVVVVPLLDGEMAIVRRDINNEDARMVEADGEDMVDCRACEVQGGAALREALLTCGTEGIRAVICIGSLRWKKDPPEWCPAELQRVVLA